MADSLLPDPSVGFLETRFQSLQGLRTRYLVPLSVICRKPLSIILAVKLARLTVDEGRVERDEEADWGEEHLDGPDEVFYR